MDFKTLLTLSELQRSDLVSSMTLAEIPLYMQFLATTLRSYSDAYYQGAPVVTDAEFDMLFDELSFLEALHPEFIDPASPTQKVGASPSKTVQHHERMYSLDKDMNPDELVRSLQSLESKLGKPLEYSCELKNDGLSISLIYTDGVLTGALTRGDGVSGEDVFVIASQMPQIPKTIPTKGIVEVRGEIYMTYSDFQAYNKQLVARGEEPKSNTRNLAVGTLKSLDPAVLQERPLSLVIYTFGRVDDPVFKASVFTQKEFLEWAVSVGFPTDRHNYIAKNIDEAVAYCAKAEQLRGTLDYQIDGVVISLNSFVDRAHPDMGFTERVPRFGRAFKFPPEKKITKVLAITWNGPSRTGRFTPVAEVEPTAIGGVTVRFVTLDNYDKIKELGVTIGAEVTLVRSGDVIPKIINVVSDRGDAYTSDKYAALPGATTPPDNCPECGSGVSRAIDEKGAVSAVYTCENEDCPARFYGQLETFVGKDRGLDIDGFGTVWVERLVSSKMVSRFSDIFSLTKDQLLSFDRTGEKTVNNLLNAISLAKKQKWSRVLASFQIHDCGNTTSRLLSEAYPEYTLLKAAVSEAAVRLNGAKDFEAEFSKMKSEKQGIAGIDSVGYKTMASLLRYFSNPVHVEEMERLVSILSIEKPIPKSTELPFSGKVFCITGNASALVPDVVLELAGKGHLKGKEITDRPTLETILQSLGGEVKSSVTKNLNVLIRGFDGGALISGSKVVAAETANTKTPGKIEFWNEDEHVLQDRLAEVGKALLQKNTTPAIEVQTAVVDAGIPPDSHAVSTIVPNVTSAYHHISYVTSENKNVWMYPATSVIPKEIADFIYVPGWFAVTKSNSPYRVEPETLAYINALFGDIAAFSKNNYDFATHVVPAAIAYESYLADTRGLYDKALSEGKMTETEVSACKESADSVIKALLINPKDFIAPEAPIVQVCPHVFREDTPDLQEHAVQSDYDPSESKTQSQDFDNTTSHLQHLITQPKNNASVDKIAFTLADRAIMSLSELQNFAGDEIKQIASNPDYRERFELAVLAQTIKSVLENPNLPAATASNAELVSGITSTPDILLWVDAQEVVWTPVPIGIYSDLTDAIAHTGPLMISQNVVGDYSISCNPELSHAGDDVVWISPIFAGGDYAGLPLSLSFFRDVLPKKDLFIEQPLLASTSPVKESATIITQEVPIEKDVDSTSKAAEKLSNIKEPTVQPSLFDF